MVLNVQASPTLLGSYDPERGGEHRALDERQTKGFHNSVYRGRVKDAAIDVAARLLPSIGTLLQGSDDLQQLSVAYPESPLSEDHLHGLADILHRHGPQAGDRAPDSQLITAQGSSTTLFAQIYNPDGISWGWTLLAFDGRKAEMIGALEAAIAAVEKWTWVRPRLVLGAATPASKRIVSLSDLDDLTHSAYGVSGKPALILIRPDGHIAFRGSADDLDRLNDYCRRVFDDDQA